ncbi:hypothetical protein [Arthrobacter antioxidans]|uniref:hypothetical protein n=1 Tax=Arthrobacter antioxidans TaxID=2895818 RepID=UPI001FFE3CE5|nr:hypothetical protein [Arthrobacter antioxidans]
MSSTERPIAPPMPATPPIHLDPSTEDDTFRTIGLRPSGSDLKRLMERRREAERKLALHIQKYRETHPLPSKE